MLVGRCVEFKIMPFSFAESCEYCQMLGRQTGEEDLFYDYMRWGGLPQRFELAQEKEVRRYLEQTYQGIVEKDIIGRSSRYNRQQLNKIAAYVMANAGKEFSAKRLAAFFQSVNAEGVDKKTVYRYLDKMERACLINRVRRFNIAGKQALAYVEKQ